MRPLFSAAATFVVLIAASSTLAAPLLEVRPATARPQIDGILDDATWRDAAHTDAFRQIAPVENGDPTERTEFWVTFDSDYLYVAVRCHDSAGGAAIRAFSMQRDQDNGSDDIVRLALDTFNRQSDGYLFALTAAGGMHDGLIQDKEDLNYQWDGLWIGKVSRDATGWSAEFAIPTKTLAFDRTNDTWGFNVARAIRRKQEVQRWSGFSRAKSVTSLPDVGAVRGLHGLHQGRGIDFKPYATVSRRSSPSPHEKRLEFNPGFDLIWHLTPSLAGTLTVNTDFADAEVDERRVNLGRFSLFFPEKRAFFTQDASLFTFAGIQRDPLPFFSRRIGLSPDGDRIDIMAGAKLTGRAGPWTLGLLDVQTDDFGAIGSQNLFAGRVSHQVFSESSVGLIATNGDPSGSGDNTLLGADFNYVNNRLAGNKSLAIRSGLQWTTSDRAGGNGTAATISVNYPNDPYNFQVWFSAIDRKYDPALGFVSRTGIANAYTFHTVRRYFEGKRVRILEGFFESDNTFTLRGKLLDHGRWTGVYAETQEGDWANAWLGHSRETYDAPFEISPGIVIPAAVHRWDYVQFQAGTTKSRPFNTTLRWRHGGFITGRTNEYEALLGARLRTRWELGLSGQLKDIHLPEGSFEVRLATVRVVYSYSPDFQISLLGQYDNVSEALGANFRIKWIVQPGNEVFFIVNQGYDTDLRRFRPTRNDTSLKAAWTIRF